MLAANSFTPPQPKPLPAASPNAARAKCRQRKGRTSARKRSIEFQGSVATTRAATEILDERTLGINAFVAWGVRFLHHRSTRRGRIHVSVRNLRIFRPKYHGFRATFNLSAFSIGAQSLPIGDTRFAPRQLRTHTEKRPMGRTLTSAPAHCTPYVAAQHVNKSATKHRDGASASASPERFFHRQTMLARASRDYLH